MAEKEPTLLYAFNCYIHCSDITLLVTSCALFCLQKYSFHGALHEGPVSSYRIIVPEEGPRRNVLGVPVLAWPILEASFLAQYVTVFCSQRFVFLDRF